MKALIKKVLLIVSFTTVATASFAASDTALPASDLKLAPNNSQLQQPGSFESVENGYFNRQSKKFYVQGNVGTNIGAVSVDNIINDPDIPTSTAAMTGLGLAGNFGYLFTQNFAAEMGYSYYMLPVYGTNYNLSVAHVDMKGILPLGKRFTLFGKLGASTLTHPLTPVTVFMPFVGVGAGYYITPHLEASVQAEGSATFLGIANVGLGMLSGGFTYYF